MTQRIIDYQRQAGDVWRNLVYPSYFKLQVCWLYYSAHPWASPLRGRSELRSNLLPADLSFTRITYLSKLIGILSLAAFLQLELFGYITKTRYYLKLDVSRYY
ncbi:hypothetical protein OI70_02475 [Dickeya fangzhongdai]|nr:hypothetical protein OI70_02475 [Dickeya fangzhongdai]